MKIDYIGGKLSIEGAKLLDERLSVNIADSFVKRNKLSYTSGNGEARLYIAGISKAGEFFGNNFTENSDYMRSIVIKDDLIYYLSSAEAEYKDPQNDYRNSRNLVSEYNKYVKALSNYEDDAFEFWIRPHQGKKDKARFYIDGYTEPVSHERAWVYNFMREIMLPQITRIQILKFLDGSTNEVFIVFRPYLWEFSRMNDPIDIDSKEKEIRTDINILETEKTQLIKARIGQGKFRSVAMKRFQSKCCITGIEQVEILDACHIKPWAYSSNEERLQQHNSLLLTKDLHKLFDLGFFSFDNNNNILLSTFLTEKVKNILKDGFFDADKSFLRQSKPFIDYHREKIYRP